MCLNLVIGFCVIICLTIFYLLLCQILYNAVLVLFTSACRACYLLNLYALIRSLSGSVHMYMIRFCLFDAYQSKKLHGRFVLCAIPGFSHAPNKPDHRWYKANN